MTDQYAFVNPVDRYTFDDIDEQEQPGPGLQDELSPKADHGEPSYRGSGRLTGRRALITGADSGNGRATAIAFACEGADIIRVNIVAPGPIWTPLHTAGGQPPSKLPEFGRSTPLGRTSQPAELAPAQVFLASGESSYVSGETLSVNGGMPTP